MAVYDDWDWLGDLGGWWDSIDLSGVADTVGNIVGGINTMFTPPGQQYINPVTGLPAVMSNQGGPYAGLVNLGQGLLSTHLQGEDAEAYLEQMQPLVDLYKQHGDWSRQYYDPTNLARMEAQEIGRMTEQAAPLLERATYRGAARGAQRGQPWGGSTQGNLRQAEQQRQAGRLFSDVIQPRASQNVLGRGTTLGNAYAQQASLLSGSPIMQPTYLAAQQNPWSVAGNLYLDSILGRRR